LRIVAKKKKVLTFPSNLTENAISVEKLLPPDYIFSYLSGMALSTTDRESHLKSYTKLDFDFNLGKTNFLTRVLITLKTEKY
jgi:hypothetical protein